MTQDFTDLPLAIAAAVATVAAIPLDERRAVISAIERRALNHPDQRFALALLTVAQGLAVYTNKQP